MVSRTRRVYGWCDRTARCSNAPTGDRPDDQRRHSVGTETGSPDEIATALRELGSATLGESGGRAAHRRLRPAWTGAAMAAPAYPVGCTPGDNLAVHVAVTKAPRGSVLALDGGVRDVGALQAHGFPVFSAAVALPGATKDKPGTVGVPVRVGGVEVS